MQKKEDLKITKGQINKVGNNLREALKSNVKISDKDLLLLQQYRITFKEPLKQASMELLRIMKLIDNEGIVTYRVKRIESILSKLERQPDMDLARCNDIAGCRCILQNEKKIFQFLDELRKSSVLEIVSKTDSNGNLKEFIYDYINNPKPNGYKSIHVICKCIDKFIEIQIRDNTQHAWATLVEITDSIYKTKIKEKDDDSNTGLKDFLRIYSKGRNLTRDERQLINSILLNTKYLKRLSHTFSKNLITIRKDWCDVEDKPGNFYLFELPLNNKPKFYVFSNFLEAEEKYFSSFTAEVNKNGSNIVMAFVQKKDFATVSKAYANYFLVKHTLFDNLLNILSNDTGSTKINDISSKIAVTCMFCKVKININEYEGCLKEQLHNHSIKYDEWLKELSEGFKNTTKAYTPKYIIKRHIISRISLITVYLTLKIIKFITVIIILFLLNIIKKGILYLFKKKNQTVV